MFASYFSIILISIFIIIFVIILKQNRKYREKFNIFSANMLSVGDIAPNFTLLDDSSNPCSLIDYRGKKVVLYFYPKDFTPACTIEACSFRDSYDVYKDYNIIVIGVNYESVESHKKFKESYNIPFKLLSDSSRKVAKKYGAYQSIRNMLFPERITYLIDEHGKIVHIFLNVSVDGHAQEILKYFKLF